MSFLFILLACFLTGFLTLLSGFGLGTLLTPFFTLIYDVKFALLLVACVHLSNNIYKLFLFRKHIDPKIFRRFGLVSFIGAIIGATLFGAISSSWIKKVFGGFLVWSGMNEFIAKHGERKIPQKWDIWGGFFSGLLGGLIGAQGAIRSAYLLNYSLSKEAFIATGTAISILIDLTRLPLYLYSQKALFSSVPFYLILLIIFSALLGTTLGKRFLHTISLKLFRNLVAVAVILVGIYFFF